MRARSPEGIVIFRSAVLARAYQFPSFSFTHTDSDGEMRGKLRETRLTNAIVVVFSSALSVSLLFSLAGLSSHLGLHYNLGYEVKPIDFTIFSKELDPLVWLASTLITAFTSTALLRQSTRRQRVSWLVFILADLAQIVTFFAGEPLVSFALSLVCGTAFLFLAGIGRFQAKSGWAAYASLLGLIVVIEFLSLISRVLSAFPNVVVPVSLMQSAGIEFQLSRLLYDFSPILVAVVIFMWVPIVPFLIRNRHKVAKIGNTPKSSRGPNSEAQGYASFAVLGLAFVMAVFIPLSQYIARPLPQGVDIRFYYGLLVSTKNLGEAVNTLGVESHGPYLLLLFLIRSLTGWTDWQVVVVGPCVLSVFFTGATFLAVSQMTGNPLISAVASLTAATWLHTAVGLFAAIYANWLAMSFLILFLYFLQKTLTTFSPVSFASTILSSYGVALAHAWTWGILIASTFVGLILTFARPAARQGRKARGKSERLIYGVVLLASTLPVAALALVLQGLNAGVQSGINIVGGMNASRLGALLSVIGFTVTHYVGGLLSYPLPLVLSMLGVVYLARRNPQIALLLLPWLAVPSIATMLLDPSFQWRLFYVLPFELFAIFGVSALLVTIDWVAERTGVTEGLHNQILLVKCLLIALIALDSINYALVAASMLPLA